MSSHARRRHLALAAAAVVLALAPRTSHAQLTQYVFTATGEGSVGGNSFSDALFHITLLADASTASTTYKPGVLAIPNITGATFDVSGLGSFTITDPLFLFVNPNIGLLGIGRGMSDFIGGRGSTTDAFNTYDLRPPFSSIFNLGLTDQISLNTAQGDLSITGATTDTPGTFTAAAVTVSTTPEPSELSLLVTGLTGMLVARRNRRRSA
jgi:hypothetical protein